MIRAAKIEDVPEVLEIYAPYVENTTITFEYTVPSFSEFTERFRQITAQFPWLVWEEDGKILGYAYGSAPFSRAAYGWCAEPSIYLRQDAQGRGIGTQLYKALNEILLLQGFQVMYALITGENTASIAFHERFGYEKRAYFPDCGFKFGRWLGVYWMEKRLKSVEIPLEQPIPWPELIQDSQKICYILDKMSLS